MNQFQVKSYKARLGHHFSVSVSLGVCTCKRRCLVALQDESRCLAASGVRLPVEALSGCDGNVILAKIWRLLHARDMIQFFQVGRFSEIRLCYFADFDEGAGAPERRRDSTTNIIEGGGKPVKMMPFCFVGILFRRLMECDSLKYFKIIVAISSFSHILRASLLFELTYVRDRVRMARNVLETDFPLVCWQQSTIEDMSTTSHLIPLKVG